MRPRALVESTLLPFRLSPLLGALAAALVLGLDAALVAAGSGGLSLGHGPAVVASASVVCAVGAYVAVGIWGTVLRNLARPETLLVPGFLPALVGGVLLWAFFLFVPVTLFALRLEPASRVFAVLGLAVFYFAILLFLSARPKRWSGVLFALPFLLFASLPRGGAAAVLRGLLSLRVGLAALLLAGFLFVLLIRRLFERADPEPAGSPLEELSRGSQRSPFAASRIPVSPWRRRLEAWATAPSERRLDTLLATVAAEERLRPRRGILRLLLLPQENPRGWSLRLLAFALFGGLWFLPFLVHGDHGPGWSPLATLREITVILGAQGILALALARERLKRHLSELYFTLGLEKRAFKDAVAGVFLDLLPGAVLVTLVLLAAAEAAADPRGLLPTLETAAAIVPFVDLFLLGLGLHAPARSLGRAVFLVFSLALLAVCLPLGGLVVHALGRLWASVVLVVLGASVALGTWTTSRRMWLDLPLDFEAPDPRLGD